MLVKLYHRARYSILGSVLEEEKDLFEKVKLELMFNLFTIFSILYFIGFIAPLINGYWYIILIRSLGVLVVIGLFTSFKKTKHYRVPVKIWTISFLVLGAIGLIISQGRLTYPNLGFSLLNISIVFLMLKRNAKVIFSVYYFLFLTYSISVSFNLMPLLNTGLNLDVDQQFFHHNILFSLLPFFLLVYILYTFITHEYRVKTLLKNQIDYVLAQEQKIEEANKTMHKSIQLASKIQKAFLPNLNNYSHLVQEHFLFLKPQNELSGDFYWSCEHEGNLYLAIIDSSENNISGAIVGSMYFDGLDSAIKKEELSSTSDIISYLNFYISNRADILTLKEGINISLVRIDTHSGKIHFSSEKNAMYIAKHNKKVIDQYRAFTILKNDSDEAYREDIFEGEKGDVIYLMSDGFAKQFDGFDNIKFKESVLKGYLTSIKKEPLSVQLQLLEGKLAEWNKNKYQTDDICMIGVKI